MVVKDDWFTPEDKILTDGSGRCSVSAMKKYQAEFYQKYGYFSCLIQIRALGGKGTLLCDPRIELDDPGIDVAFRDSMIKFDTQCSTTMCVVKVAEFNPLTLNREVINLLCAIRDSVPVGDRTWNPHSTFVKMQDEVLNVLGQMLIDPESAIGRLSEHIPAETLRALSESGMNLLSEPLLMSMLHLKYFNDTKMLRCKHHIPVQHGALTMGAPDPTKVLNDGEIFLCIRRPMHSYAGCFDENNEYHLGGGIKLIRIPEPLSENKDIDDGMTGQGFETFVVTGPVLMYRNPCLDPGDHRVVQAVNEPKLYFWKNAVLLPAASSCRRSLSAECSGGDLDGDMFGVIWDPRLVPPQELEFEAVDYEKIAKEAKERCPAQDLIDWKDGLRLRERIAEFVARAMSNSCLGKIAVKHLAVCDILSVNREKDNKEGKGAAHSLARELAKCQSLAVDFPKTGVAPKIPKEANDLVRRNGRPHFMEKTEMLSYLSRQSLGLLYDVVSTVACTVAIARTDREFSSDAMMYVRGREQFDQEAEELYIAYEREVQGLMLRFGLQCEAEMVMGAPQAWSDEFSLDHEAAAQSLAASWKALQKNYTDAFNRSLPDESSLARQQKASAWYHAAYKSKHSLHSFAWIVSAELAAIRISAKQATQERYQVSRELGGQWKAHRDVTSAVGGSAAKVWRKGRLLTHTANAMKEQVFQRVKEAILNSDELKSNTEVASKIEFHRYGSTVLLLCDPQSDVDLTVYIPTYPKNKALTILESIVYPSVSQIAVKSQLVKDATVPLVTLLVDDSYTGTKVDISAQNMDGVLKSRLIRCLYVQQPENLLVFSSLMQWARCCGLRKELTREQRTSPLNSGQLQALIVKFLLQRSDAQILSEEQMNDPAITTHSIQTAAEKITESDQESLGETLLSFFLFYEQLGQQEVAFDFSWPVEGTPVHSIAADTMREVGACCRRALHCLCVSWDWGHLLENAIAFEKSRTTLQIELSPALSKGIAPNKEYFAMILRWKSKAQVKITSSASDHGKLIVQGSGSYRQIQVLRYELLHMIYQGRMLSHGAVRTMSNAYFMEGSSFLYARGTASKESMLEMTPICAGDYLLRQIHQCREHSTLKVSDIVAASETEWTNSFKAEFCKKMMEQMDQLGTVRGDGQVIFSTHYGKLLLLDASKSFERSRGARSCTEIEAAMNNIKNMKLEDYSPNGDKNKEKDNTVTEQTKNKGAGSSQSQASTKSGQTTHSARADGAGQKLKKHLTTAFLSGVPIMPGKASGEGEVETIAWAAADYEENIAMARVKFENIFSALQYTKFDFSHIPVTQRDGATGAAWWIPGTTLTVPAGEWRTAVDLTDTHQLNVDLGPNGEIRDVVERFVSFVNGTLVDPAVETASSDDASDANAETVYDFKKHDLRFKFGIMNAVSSVKHQTQFESACPKGQAPIEFYPSSELEAHLKDNSTQGGITSKMLSEYTQAMLSAGKEFVCVRPAATLASPNMVSFARHVTHRCAYFSPELSHTVNENMTNLATKDSATTASQQPGLAAPPLCGASFAEDSSRNSTNMRKSSAKVMAVLAMGEHFEGDFLARINPFVDISLEVDATQLLKAMHISKYGQHSNKKKKGAGEGREDDAEGSDNGGDTGADDNTQDNNADASEVELLSLAELDEHIQDICDELLRVSAVIKEMW